MDLFSSIINKTISRLIDREILYPNTQIYNCTNNCSYVFCINSCHQLR